MDLTKLLNREESQQVKRRPLGSLSTNESTSRGLKNDSQPRMPVRLVRLDKENDVPASLKKAITLPPISQVTKNIRMPVPQLPEVPTGQRQSSSGGPLHFNKSSSVTNRTTSGYLYSVQNSKNSSDAQFFKINSSGDFQKFKTKPSASTPVKQQEGTVVPLSSSKKAHKLGSKTSPDKPSKRNIIWCNEASLIAAQEFKKIYQRKGSSSFLKKEYQMVAQVLNTKLSTDKYTETAVRNRKGLFQSLSSIYVYLKETPQLNKFDDKYVPQLTQEQWRHLSNEFEPSYVRKYRAKSDNTDIHITHDMFKKKSIRVENIRHLNVEQSLKGVCQILLMNKEITPLRAMALELFDRDHQELNLGSTLLSMKHEEVVKFVYTKVDLSIYEEHLKAQQLPCSVKR